MAVPTISQTINASGTATSSVATASQTPSADDLLIALVAIRFASGGTPVVTGISGNGATWAKLDDEETSSFIRSEVWYAQPASPSAGTVTATLDETVASLGLQVIRIAGAATGANGLTAIEAWAVAKQDLATSNLVTVDVTTATADTLALATIINRVYGFSVGTGETANSINNSVGSGGDILRWHSEYQDVASPATVTLNGTFATATPWIIHALAIKPPGAASYDDSVTLAREHAVTDSGSLSVGVSSTLSKELGVTDGGSLTTTQALSLSRSEGLTGAASLTVTQAVSLGRLEGLGAVSTLTAENLLTLVRVAGLTAGGGLSVSEALTLARVHALTVADTVAFIEALALGRAHGIAVTSGLVGVGTLTLARSEGLDAASLIAAGASLTLARIAGAAAAGSLTVGEVLTLGRAVALATLAQLAATASLALGRAHEATGQAQITAWEVLILSRSLDTGEVGQREDITGEFTLSRALGVSIRGNIVLPALNIITPGADSRIYTVLGDRVITIAADSRIIEVED